MTQNDDSALRVFTDLLPAELIELAIIRREATLANNGTLLLPIGNRTDLSPADQFIVDEPSTTDAIAWGADNQPFPQERFDALWEKVHEHLSRQDRFVSHLHVGQDPEHYLAVKISSETAWHSLFAHNIFIRPDKYNPSGKQQWKILHASHFRCNPDEDGTNSDGAVIINFARRKVLLAGMAYGGEIKRALFSVLHFLLAEKDVMPMHCAANAGHDGSVALFFGLSGAGKTSLSTDPDRLLIGDDAHGWSRGAVFNLEGGCYAKTHHLKPATDPLIWDAIHFGATIENVVMDEQRRPAYDDTGLTQNGRCSYPLEYIESRCMENRGAEPRHILFLTCDISGALPPLAILHREAAIYHFLSGYGARGWPPDPDDNSGISMCFFPCYGAPFIPGAAHLYGELLGRRIEDSGSHLYLVNTGWSGECRDTNSSGKRTPIAVTRAIVRAITSGALEGTPTQLLPLLNLRIPTAVPGIDSHCLDPRNTWGDPQEWENRARQLAQQFVDNFRQFDVSEQIVMAGPQPS